MYISICFTHIIICLSCEKIKSIRFNDSLLLFTWHIFILYLCMFRIKINKNHKNILFLNTKKLKLLNILCIFLYHIVYRIYYLILIQFEK